MRPGVTRQLKTELRKLAFRVRENAQTAVNRPAPYKRRGSPAGTPPYKRTGRLQKSIVYKVQPDGMSAQIGVLHRSRGWYGHALEYGYTGRTVIGYDLARNKKGQYILLKNGKKKRKNIRYKNIAVPARPYMRPALRKVTG